MSFTGDFDGLDAIVSTLNGLVSNGSKRMSKVAAVEGKRLIDEGFDRGVSPLDIPWVPLKHRQGRPLVLTGALKASFATTDNGQGFVASSSSSYATVHQKGAKTRKAKKKKGKKAKKRGRIPARPMLPDSPNPTRWVKGLESVITKEAEDILK